MAIRSLHGLAANFRTTLAAGVAIDALSAVVATPSMPYPSVPFRVYIGVERVRVTAVSASDPEAGQDTWTIERAQNGTTATSHTAGKTVRQLASAYDAQERDTRLTAASVLVAAMLGVTPGSGTSGVQRTGTGTDLQVVAQDTPDMTVRVLVGAGVASGEPVALIEAYDTGAIEAPTGDPRIDLVEIDQDGAIHVVEGSEASSPEAPATTSGRMALAQIYLRVGATSIKDADDSTNGYITDARSYL